MQDHELYRHIFGIEPPWYEESVDSKLAMGRVHVDLHHVMME
jgi:hypothetical protein